MIFAYCAHENFQSIAITPDNEYLLEDAVWIDLLSPNPSEEVLVEKFLEVDIPTRAEMQEIEPSNRLYKVNDAVFMTGTMVAKSDTSEPKNDAVTLVVTNNRLITVRYLEFYAFDLFIERLPKLTDNRTGISLVIAFLEAVVDRLADIFENAGRALDDCSARVFRKSNFRTAAKIDYKKLLQDIGLNGDLNTKVWESLVSFNRLIAYFTRNFSTMMDETLLPRLDLINKDINALSDHVKFIMPKVNFLLDATLGMVNIEQNNIIKIFSIAAVILLPPTLVATIYGMNFHSMPELSWRYGYPYALGLMFFSAWIPYQYFKIKKWL